MVNKAMKEKKIENIAIKQLFSYFFSIIKVKKKLDFLLL